MAPFLWGKAELVSFTNSDGVPLQAGLIKPEMKIEIEVTALKE